MYAMVLYMICDHISTKKLKKRLTSLDEEKLKLENEMSKLKEELSRVKSDNVLLRNTNEQLIECTRGNDILMIQRSNQEIQKLKEEIESIKKYYDNQILELRWNKDFGDKIL